MVKKAHAIRVGTLRSAEVFICRVLLVSQKQTNQHETRLIEYDFRGHVHL